MDSRKVGMKRRRPEGATMEYTTNGRKSIACRSLLFFASLMAVSVQGFSSIPSIARSRQSLRYSVHLSFTQAVEEQLTVPSKLPPWLTQHEVATWADVVQQIETLERRLIHLGWEDFEIGKVLQDISNISWGDRKVALGCMDFINVYMDSLSSDLSSSVFFSPAVLQASIKHYVQCVLVRKSGVLGNVKDDFLIKTPRAFSRDRKVSKRVKGKKSKSLQLQQKANSPMEIIDSSAIVPLHSSARVARHDPEVDAICIAAARIKRAEVLIQTILPPSHAVSDRVQGLLLSLTDDFRALMIRCVACLYRLQGVASNDPKKVDPQTIRLAKDGLQVYSILAGRLGLPQLKKQIENAAFRVLYRRQYQAVSSYYTEVGPLMNTVANYLQAEAIQTLRSDDKLMALVEDLDVESRVKEPLSLWKKLLKKSRGRALVLADHSRIPAAPVVIDNDPADTQAFPPGLVSSGVFDFVALRVVVRARKWSENEDDELTREREKLLCYYVQNRLGAQWGASRVKDYIQFPKSNGYQSLHHTSGIALRGEIHIPFEVQIRSGEMHDTAEYGYASHWCYKLGSSDAVPETKLLQPCDAEPVPAVFRCETDDGSVDESLLRQIDKPSKSYLDALHLAKKAEANVYVFMGSEDDSIEYTGDLISLPSNARVRDALAVVRTRELASEVEDKTIMRNGQKAGLNEPVANGDVLWLRAA